MEVDQNEQNKITIDALQKDINTIKDSINRLNNAIINLDSQRLQNLTGQIQNGLETIAKQDILQNDTQEVKDAKSKSFINFRNAHRRMMGLNTVNYIYCKICRQVNAHYTNYCPFQRCTICLNLGHNWKRCTSRFRCQICGSNDHPTECCREDNAEEMRADKFRTCMLCGTKGHIAMNCDKTNAGYRPRTPYRRSRFNMKRNGFRGRGRFRGRRGRGRY